MSNIDHQFPTDEEAKEYILEVGRRMYAKNYVVSNDGNISCKVSDHEIWATPTGMSKGYMTEDMLIKLDLDGNVLEGTAKPSSEIKMHLRVYKEDPELMAVCHAHPMHATLFAIANRPIDSKILAEGVVQLGVVPCAPTVIPGTSDVPDSIAPYVKDYNAVLLGNHGALTWSTKNVMDAYMRMESLEYFAEIILKSEQYFKSVNEFTEEQVEELIKIRENLGIHRGGRPS